MAGVTQSVVSRIDRGDLEGLQVRKIRAVFRALEMELDLDARWRGGELDRLADEDHAELIGCAARLLQAAGWETHIEVSYSVYGERGSIDLLAWHPGARILLVVEVKTGLYSVEETLRRHDAKLRLAAGIAAERFGWRAAATARLLVLPDASTPRRRVARHDAVLGRAYPLRADAARAWLRDPGVGAAPGAGSGAGSGLGSGAGSGLGSGPGLGARFGPGLLIFASPTPRGTSNRRRVTRVRVRRRAT